MKKLLLISMVLMLLVAIIAYYLLYTSAGASQTLRYLINHQQLPVTFGELNGQLGKQLEIRQVVYHDDQYHLTIGQLQYQLDWSLWKREVHISMLQINDVNIQSMNHIQNSDTSQVLPALSLPGRLMIDQFEVNNLTYQDQEFAEDIPQISAALSWQNDHLDVIELKIDHEQINLNARGAVMMSANWPFDTDISWQWQNDQSAEAFTISGESRIDGTANRITGRHLLAVDHPHISGKTRWLTQLSSGAGSVLNIQMAEPGQLTVKMAQGDVQLDLSQAEVSGQPDSYQASMQAKVLYGQFPEGRLEVTGKGGLGGFDVEQLKWEADDQQLLASLSVGWQEAVTINSHLTVNEFDPGRWGLDWPGQVSGELQMDAEQYNDDWYLRLNHSQLQGTLKSQAFKFSGTGQWLKDNYQANDLILRLGVNELHIDGQYGDGMVEGSIKVDWPELTLIDPQLKGQAKGQILLSGDFGNPDFSGSLNSAVVAYAGVKASGVKWLFDGTWDKRLHSQLQIADLVFRNRSLSAVELNATGWLNSHDIDLNMAAGEIQTTLNLQGQLMTTQPMPIWQGILMKHEVVLADGRQISMNQPAKISWGEVFEISEVCWNGVAAGQLCVQSDQISASAPVTGQLSVQSFSADAFRPLLPEQWRVTGLINGTASYELSEQAVQLSSDFHLAAGQLGVRTPDGQWITQGINELTLNAKNEGQNVGVSSSVVLDDDSFIRLKAELFQQDSEQDWQINADMSGQINNQALVTGLTDEISELRGAVHLSGRVAGSLRSPDIFWELSQPEGHLKLTRMGTRLEQVALSIETRRERDPVYQIELQGFSQSDRHRGELLLTGSMITQPEWVFKGQLQGTHFTVMNLPELTIDISPDLTVEANKKQARIAGDVTIPYGHVAIKSLPPEGVSNSPDLVVIRDQKNEPEELSYPIILDVNARIIDPVQLDVIGLSADMTGQLNIRQGIEQQLTGYGDLKLINGRYEVYGQKLNIDTGELNFAGDLANPRLNVKATRQATVDDVKAGVKLTGTVENLRSELYSEPTMPDVEKLAYIMTGQGIKGAGNLDSESLKQAAIVLGLNQSSPVFKQIQQQFGIDVLTVKRNGAQSESVIEAGKKINDDLYISYNQGLFNRLGFWVLKYRINQYLNLQTTQGDDQSVELVYTRKSEPPKQKRP
ncbi:translocation/assembly module TamB domain-containing protein [Marinicella sediminis]|uniref:Translocation/assembly module TamB domain-containing protein n=1 Tax=Marinicella sediminis TaxID=1792834 RepID=A0ABV7JC02_9GAMM|nr:translocation/assembly module TamB domain-containing protein [Marinicella sediminis]